MGLSGPFPGNSRLCFTVMAYLKPLGLSGLEPPTSRLSGVRSNLLSYKPLFFCTASFDTEWR